MKLAPLSEETRRGQIVRSIRDLIVSGAVPAGHRLTETELAERLGVSRAPLREAMRELVGCGLLVSQPYRGIFVRGFTRRDLEELYSFRTTLERMAFREAWDKRSEAALIDLDARHAALVATCETTQDPNECIELELRLHGWCYELSGHSLLQDAWQRLWPNLQFYFALHQRAHKRPGPRKDAHRTYVACAKGGDLDAMLDHLDAHMRQGLDRTLGYLGQADSDGATEEAGTTRSDTPTATGRLT